MHFGLQYRLRYTCLYADDGKLYEVIETRITNSVGNATRVPEKPGNRPFSNP